MNSKDCYFNYCTILNDFSGANMNRDHDQTGDNLNAIGTCQNSASVVPFAQSTTTVDRNSTNDPNSLSLAPINKTIGRESNDSINLSTSVDSIQPSNINREM